MTVRQRISNIQDIKSLILVVVLTAAAVLILIFVPLQFIGSAIICLVAAIAAIACLGDVHYRILGEREHSRIPNLRPLRNIAVLLVAAVLIVIFAPSQFISLAITYLFLAITAILSLGYVYYRLRGEWGRSRRHLPKMVLSLVCALISFIAFIDIAVLKNNTYYPFYPYIQ